MRARHRHTPRPAAVPAPDTPGNTPGPADGGRADAALLGSDPSVRALGRLLEYAAHQARTQGEMPADVLEIVSGALAAREDQDAVAIAIGVRLPALHRYAPAFTAAHRTVLYGLAPGRPTSVASWLCWGAFDREVTRFPSARHAVPSTAPSWVVVGHWTVCPRPGARLRCHWSRRPLQTRRSTG